MHQIYFIYIYPYICIGYSKVHVLSTEAAIYNFHILCTEKTSSFQIEKCNNNLHVNTEVLPCRKLNFMGGVLKSTHNKYLNMVKTCCLQTSRDLLNVPVWSTSWPTDLQGWWIDGWMQILMIDYIILKNTAIYVRHKLLKPFAIVTMLKGSVVLQVNICNCMLVFCVHFYNCYHGNVRGMK